MDPKLFKWQRSANYSIQTQFRGQRMAFTSARQTRRSRLNGRLQFTKILFALESTPRLRSIGANDVKEPVGIATVGQWIEAARGVSTSNPATFAQYSASLRLIAGQILSVKKTKKRFGPGKGGARAYRAGIDAASLEILSGKAVQRWRLAYVAQAKNPAQERSRMTSANSTIRQAGAFSLIRSFASSPTSGFPPLARLLTLSSSLGKAHVTSHALTRRHCFARHSANLPRAIRPPSWLCCLPWLQGCGEARSIRWRGTRLISTAP